MRVWIHLALLLLVGSWACQLLHSPGTGDVGVWLRWMDMVEEQRLVVGHRPPGPNIRRFRQLCPR